MNECVACGATGCAHLIRILSEGILMPNKPRADNPHRMVRVEDSLWSAAKAKASDEGTTVSAVIREALTEFVQNPTNHPNTG